MPQTLYSYFSLNDLSWLLSLFSFHFLPNRNRFPIRSNIINIFFLLQYKYIHPPRIHGVIWCALCLSHTLKYLPTYSPHTHTHTYTSIAIFIKYKKEKKKFGSKNKHPNAKKREIEIIKICNAIQWTRSAWNIKKIMMDYDSILLL